MIMIFVMVNNLSSSSSNNSKDNWSLSNFNKLLIALGMVWILWWPIKSMIDHWKDEHVKELIEIMEDDKEPMQEGDYILDEEDLISHDIVWSTYKDKYENHIPVLKLKWSDIRKKPLDLHYIHKIPDKKINIEWSSSDAANRIVKVLRFADITDKIENIYGIPNWLLLALAAHESTWNPLLPNLWWDGWAGLSHIQGINADIFWLTTLPLSTKKMIDRKHGKLIDKELKNSKQHMDYMIDKDDRFHPVLGLDVVWRFLLDIKERKWKNNTWQDLWIHILKWYSWRWDAYVREILKYRYTVQSYRWKKLPTFSKWYQDYIDWLKDVAKIRKDLINGKDIDWHKWFKAKINGKSVTTKQYFQYFHDRLDNYEFDKYSAFMDRKAILAKNGIIDQNVINSEWFRIYKKEQVSDISKLIWLLNDLNNWSYKRIGTDNIVDSKGNILKELPKNKTVYIKIKYTAPKWE